MAASDNVVRAGLTPKHKDVETLCRMLHYHGRPAHTFLLPHRPLTPATVMWDPPVPEFALWRTHLVAEGVVAEHPGARPDVEHVPGIDGPSVLLVTQGIGRLRIQCDGAEDAHHTLYPGAVVFLGAHLPVVLEAVLDVRETDVDRAGGELVCFRAFCTASRFTTHEASDEP